MGIQRKSDGLYALRLPGVTVHVLVDDDGAVLIDCGLVGCRRMLTRLFDRLGLEPSDLRAVLLTHGHLDHVRGASAVRRWSDAPVFAHPDEGPHLEGSWPYRGWSRLTGLLEGLGRFVLGYEAVAIDHPLADGEELDLWGGLRVLHLPGHTAGHCAFYSPRRDILFSGDLFASYLRCTHRAPFIFNSDPRRFPRSFARVMRLDPARIYPSHYGRRLDGEHLRRRFDQHFVNEGRHA